MYILIFSVQYCGHDPIRLRTIHIRENLSRETYGARTYSMRHGDDEMSAILNRDLGTGARPRAITIYIIAITLDCSHTVLYDKRTVVIR